MFKLTIFELKRILKNKVFILATIVISLFLLGLTFLPQIFRGNVSSNSGTASIEYNYKKSDFNNNKVYFGDDFKDPEDLIALMNLSIQDIASSESELENMVKQGSIHRGIVFKSPTEYRVIVKNNNLFNSSDDIIALLDNFNFNTYLKSNNINPSVLNHGKEYNIKGTVTSLEGRGSTGYIVNIIIMIMFYALILFYGNSMVINIIKEKKNGVYETVYSFTNSFSLSISKVIAYSIVGVLQFMLYMSFILIGLNRNKEYYMSEGFDSMGGINFNMILIYLLFIILGFIFYLLLYNILSNFIKKVDNVVNISIPILFLLSFVIISTFVGVNYINGQFMYILSLLPFSSIIVAPLLFNMTNMEISSILISVGILVFINIILAIISIKANKKYLYIKKDF
ncbi:ABC transporter permease [Miniphocaeibacter massiliensis]|uniref:ABC transporter permease n=1 Tax=Miniphocaeibacter massiliensis TaxID=2041841 RepID=UPI000C07EAD2|nr:ABC transporter permease [Miniphocaeibacter massiliensis]